MITTIQSSFNYDNRNDILYLNVGTYSPSLAEEILDFVYVKHSEESDEITQIIIENFKNFNSDKLKNTEIRNFQHEIAKFRTELSKFS